jgi:YbbR domain-containing protein
VTSTLTSRLGYKLVALGAAVVLWLTLVDERELATSIPVSVQYRNLPADLELISDPLDRLYLKLRGPATQLNMQALSSTSVVLDLSGVHTAGEQTFAIGTKTLSLPVGVSVERTIPSQIRLRFEERKTKDIVVEARFAGPPPPGYRVASQQVFPPNLRIVGPESHINLVDSAQTDPIDLSGTVGNAQFRVSAYVSDPQVRFEDQSALVTVRVNLEKVAQ